MELVIQMLWLACGLAAVPVLLVLGRMWIESVRGAHWDASEFGFRPFDLSRSRDIRAVISKADAVLANA